MCFEMVKDKNSLRKDNQDKKNKKAKNNKFIIITSHLKTIMCKKTKKLKRWKGIGQVKKIKSKLII